MKRNWKMGRKVLLKYGIPGGICLGIAEVYCYSRQFFYLETAEKYRVLCDAFTVPGLLCLCIGALIWASNDGFFCGIGYCLKAAWRGLIPGVGHKTEGYYDYVTRKQEKRIIGYGFLFVDGAVCMAAALVFFCLFYSLS